MLDERQLSLVLRDRSRFGRGSIDHLPALLAEAGCGRAWIVTDPGVVASGVTGKVSDVLSRAGIDVGVYDGVEPNPAHAACAGGAEALRRFGTEGTAVVPVGGGSSMDTAKVVSLAALNPEVRVSGLGYDDERLRPGRPLVAVPTTAGTGAETNSFGVITDAAAGRKTYIGHPSLLPVATLLDPDLTRGLPPAATAATGVDAMTHSLESLLSLAPNPFAEALATFVIRTVSAWLPRAVADGGDMEARSQLLFASHLAGLGQASGTGVGAVHAIGHALGTLGRLSHGTALATVLPEVLETYLEVRPRELALVGVAIGVADPRQSHAEAAVLAIAGVRDLLLRVGQRRTLRELGVSERQEALIARHAVEDPAIRNSPRLPDEAEIADILASVRG